MKSIVIEKPNEISLVHRDVPEPGPREVMIQVMASGICGTDLHIYRGEYLGSYPVIPGHEFSGVVIAVGSAVTRFKVGDRVAVEPNISCDNCVNCLNNRQNFCLNWQAIGVTLPGGMEEYVIAPEKAVFSIGDLPFEYGAFMEPLSCVVHGIERAHIGLADHVAILGAGPIGNLMIQMARLQGAARITVLESNPGRADSARQLKADVVVNHMEELLLGFRTTAGVSRRLCEALPRGREALARLRAEGLVDEEGDRVVPTLAGMLLADSIPLLFFD